jgi:two-component system, sensor histidine kinase and response regulator
MEREQIRILYLDDEENNLTSFKAAFRRDYKIFITTTAQEAVQILTDNEIHIVISDQKMPNISGVEFFELIVPDFPDPVRMLLTGYADIEAVIDAINKGQIYRYIAKPWNEQELKITIENAYEVFQNRREIRMKSAALENLFDELSLFVQNASHDLREPIAAIIGASKLGRQDPAGNQKELYFDIIEQSARKLDVMTHNLVDLFLNLKDREPITSVSFASIIDEVVAPYQAEAGDQVEIRKEITQDGDFLSDELKLKMIIKNLVFNAVKFRDANKPASFVRVSSVSDANKLVLEIEDNGVGIARENLGQIFDAFYSADNEKGGSGVGLHIVKATAENLGGSINVSSVPGEGTKFRMEIPNKHG